jgi:hypothetical protein
VTSRQCSFGRKLSVRIQAIGIALLGIGGGVALVSFGTRLGQTLGAILVLIGGALMVAGRLVLPAGAEADLSASPAARTEDSYSQPPDGCAGEEASQQQDGATGARRSRSPPISALLPGRHAVAWGRRPSLLGGPSGR